MYYYVNIDKEGFYIESDIHILTVGDSYQDFLDGVFVQLSNVQLAYHNDHPEASVRDVLFVMSYEDGVVTFSEDYLPQVKNEKFAALEEYDESDNINDFTVNGEIHAWFTPDERSNFKSSIESAKTLGVENLQLFIGDTLFTIPTTQAEVMLAQIQLYADNCYIRTKQHQIAIEALDSVAAVDAYDFTVGYPEKLNFNI